jgi:membrane fusion protein (multidrug efflux system)
MSEPACNAPAEASKPVSRRPVPAPEVPPAESRVVELDVGAQRAAPPKSLLRRRPLISALGLAALLATAGIGYLYYDYTNHFESTDDAFIAARQFSVAPQVSGYITAVLVTDNQHVTTGQVIARIDDRPYKIALAQAQAQVDAAQAAIQVVDAQINTQQAQIDSNQAQVEQTKAGLVFAQEQADRFRHLATTGYGTVQNEQQFDSQLRQQQAALSSAQSTLKVSQRQIETLKAQRQSDTASLAQTQAQRDQAALNLSYTAVTAAQPGRVVSLSGAVGEFAPQGIALTMFVPDDVWVVANFKETQLDAMRPGQKATLRIDAYPGRDIAGYVDSVQSGSGPAFSLLPPENATGNFVKIVQRVPVKIHLDNPPTDVALGPGMSVEPSVRTNPSPSIYERLLGRL